MHYTAGRAHLYLRLTVNRQPELRNLLEQENLLNQRNPYSGVAEPATESPSVKDKNTTADNVLNRLVFTGTYSLAPQGRTSSITLELADPKCTPNAGRGMGLK